MGEPLKRNVRLLTLNMELDDIINTWYRLASQGTIEPNEEGNVFFKFVAVWVAFNALYASRFSNEAGDREQVIRFAGQPDVIDGHRRLTANDPAYVAAINVLAEHGVANLRNGNRRRIGNINNLNEVLGCA